MPMIFQTISEHGTSNPIVARLLLQTSELLKNTKLDKTTRENIAQASMDVGNRILRCWEIWNWLNEQQQKCMLEFTPIQGKGAIEIPHIINLHAKVENFLYESKNAVRELTAAFNASFDTDFKETSQFARIKSKNSDAVKWSLNKYGKNDDLTRFLEHYQVNVAKIISLRNAIEHPNGYSGNLYIHNYQLSGSHLLSPTWHLNDENPEKISIQLEQILLCLFTFAEGVIVHIINKNLDRDISQIYEIPENERNLDNPIRYVVDPLQVKQ